jgi:hypothetical protein
MEDGRQHKRHCDLLTSSVIWFLRQHFDWADAVESLQIIRS